MREKIVNSIVGYIKAHKTLDEETEDKVVYGLESIYILVTKLTIISIVACVLHLFKEYVIFLFIFNAIRTFGFGMHASKGYVCMIISLISFLGLPYLCKMLVIPNIIKLIIGILSIILIFKNCPADTHKRPIVNKKRRKKLKIISTIISIIFVTLSFFTTDFISNCLLLSLLLEVVFSSPLTYKIFKLPYNNYLNYIERNENNAIC